MGGLIDPSNCDDAKAILTLLTQYGVSLADVKKLRAQCGTTSNIPYDNSFCAALKGLKGNAPKLLDDLIKQMDKEKLVPVIIAGRSAYIAGDVIVKKPGLLSEKVSTGKARVTKKPVPPKKRVLAKKKK